MHICKDELKEMAEAIKLNLTEEELIEIEASITTITGKLNELLKVEVDDEAKTHGTDLSNVYAADVDPEQSSMQTMKDINNFDGEYVHVKKVIGDE